MKKILLNFGPTALKTVGFSTYLTMWATLVSVLGKVLKSHDLKVFDQKFGKGHGKTSFRVIGDKPFALNLRRIDEMIVEPSFAFGLARELYFRRCYLHGHGDLKPEEIGTVVDLGANRGTFSSMCTPYAKKIIMVEPLTKYNPCIAMCMEDNGFKDYAVHNCFVGSDMIGTAEGGTPVMPFEELLSRSGVDRVDFLKMDIEGGEFQLFEDGLPLEKIARIAMEMHAPKGDPTPIVDKLRSAGFEVSYTDSVLNALDNPRHCEFLFATNRNLLKA